MFCLRYFDDFISNRDFTVETDHKALLTILDHSTRVVANWLSIICEYTFDIIHVPGATNICPDSLSPGDARRSSGRGRSRSPKNARHSPGDARRSSGDARRSTIKERSCCTAAWGFEPEVCAVL